LQGALCIVIKELRGEGVWLKAAQLRAARGLLNVSAGELAEEAKVSLKTIRRAEQGDGVVLITAINAQQLVAVLEARGIRFIDSKDEIGVTLSTRRSKSVRRLSGK
jgi:predicted transcriptional regulator